MTNFDVLIKAARAKETLADLLAMVPMTEGSEDLRFKSAMLRMRAEELRVAAWIAA